MKSTALRSIEAVHGPLRNNLPQQRGQEVAGGSTPPPDEEKNTNPRKVVPILEAALLLLMTSCGGGGSSGSGGNIGNSGANEWTWLDGSDAANQAAVWGTMGQAAPSNVPGARSQAATWTDRAGNLWMFGGADYPASGTVVFFNDLWRYGAGEWTWMGGSNTTDQPGAYGVEGSAAPSNIPGARTAAAHWVDPSGNFWLFGGYGYDSTGTLGDLNDLWEYNDGEWTWMGGSNIVNQGGVYGAPEGSTAPGNIPGARQDAAGWVDSAGNFWLFGGRIEDTPNDSLSDLWEYKGGEWAWMGGTDGIDQNGTYGTQGTPLPSNIPGARYAAVTWVDTSGNFWLFGGYGYDSVGAVGVLNDLWKYGAGEWTWMSGANVVGQSGTYGTQGTPTAGNTPGARSFGMGWTDTTGNLWLFSGDGYGVTAGVTGRLNDLWRYSGGEWTWIGGSDDYGQNGIYGTQGESAPANIPGGRNFAVGWIDEVGDFWLFGGYGRDSVGTIGNLGDLWKYVP